MNAIDEQTYLADIEESFPRPMRRLEDEEPELPPYELLRQENDALHEEVRYLRALLESNKGGRGYGNQVPALRLPDVDRCHRKSRNPPNDCSQASLPKEEVRT